MKFIYYLYFVISVVFIMTIIKKQVVLYVVSLFKDL